MLFGAIFLELFNFC